MRKKKEKSTCKKACLHSLPWQEWIRPNCMNLGLSKKTQHAKYLKMWGVVFPYTGNKIIQTKIPVDSPSKPQKYIYEWLPTKMYFLTNFLLYFVIHVSLTRVRHEYVKLTKISFQFGPGIHLELVTYNNYSPFRRSKLQSFFFFT